MPNEIPFKQSISDDNLKTLSDILDTKVVELMPLALETLENSLTGIENSEIKVESALLVVSTFTNILIDRGLRGPTIEVTT